MGQLLTIIMSNQTRNEEKKYSEIEFCYYVSKLAKQYEKHEQKLYSIKNSIIRKLYMDGEIELKGFHTVGKYIHGNRFGTTAKKFYASYYETPCGKFGFHLPRENGRGKGYLGELDNLSENKEIKKIGKSLIKDMKKDERIATIIQSIAKEEKEKRKIEKIKLDCFNDWIKENEFYTDTICGKYDDDSATFNFEVIDNLKIKLTNLISDYSWSKKYSYSHKSIGDILEADIDYNEYINKYKLYNFMIVK